MSQNYMALSWTRQEFDAMLHSIMQSIHETAFKAATDYGFEGNYVFGTNIVRFLKFANAMMDQGIV